MPLRSAPFNPLCSTLLVALTLTAACSETMAPVTECSGDPEGSRFEIIVQPDFFPLRVGDDGILRARAFDSANGAEVRNPQVQWASSEPAVADVQALGDSVIVKALDEGEAEVVASLDQSCGSATVTAVPALPPDTSLIAFVHWDLWGDISSVRVIRADGSEEWTLDSFGMVGSMGNLNRFPHGQRVALSVGSDFPLNENVADLFLLDVNDPAPVQLDFYKWDFAPSVDPAGKTLVFRVQSDHGIPDSIAVAPVDGSVHSVIAGGGGSPMWTPSGDSIIFSRDLSIFRIHRDGGAEAIVATLGWPAGDFEYSPDGLRLLLTGYPADDPEGEIYLMNADGSGLQRLSYREGRDGSPSWSDDGTRFVFTRGNRLAIQEVGDTSSVLLTLYPTDDRDIDRFSTGTAGDPAWLR